MADQGTASALAHCAFAAQLSLGIVFLFSAWPKLRRPRSFAQSVVAYDILPANVAYVFGLILIPLEALLAIAFLTGLFGAAALPLAALLLLSFLVAVGVNVWRGRRIACGCFGEDSEEISPRTLTRLLMLLGVVLFLAIFRASGSAAIPRIETMRVDMTTLIYLSLMVFVAVFLILLANWILSLPELLALIRYVRRQPSPVNTQAEAGTEGH